MKENYIKQFEQFYRIFAEIVNAYNNDTWKLVGHKKTVPQKLSFHILQSIKYYINDKTDFISNGKILVHDYKIDDEFTITKEEIIANISKQNEIIEKWVNEIELNKNNESFPWTGNDLDSVVIFIIRHSYFHLGELNCLLNEYLLGEGDDFFAKNIW